jgi:hypothetical protein
MKFLIERPYIVTWRGSYLQKIKVHHNEGREIFCLDDSWVDSNLTYKKCWQSEEARGVCADENAGNTRIMVHVGSSACFLKDAELVHKTGMATGDYHGR